MTLEIAPRLPQKPVRPPQSAAVETKSEIESLARQYSQLVSTLDYHDFRSLIGALNDIRNVTKVGGVRALRVSFDDKMESPLEILAEYGFGTIRDCLESLRKISGQPFDRLAVDASLLARISCKGIYGVNIVDPSNPAATLGSDQIIQIHVEGCPEFIEIYPGQDKTKQSHVKIKSPGPVSHPSDFTLASGQAIVSGRKLLITKLFGQACDFQDSFPLGPNTLSHSWSRGSVLIHKLEDGNIALFDRGTKLPLTVKAFQAAPGPDKQQAITMHFTYSGKRGNDGKPGNTFFHTKG